jgi:hypothetical protein
MAWTPAPKRSNAYTMWHALIAFAAASCITASPKRDAAPTGHARGCAITTLEQRRLRLRDRTWIAMEPMQVARAGEFAAVVGRYVTLWPGNTETSPSANRAPLPRSDSILGLIIGPNDSVREIPNPFPGARVINARVAAGRPDRWHVLITRIAPPSTAADSGGLPADMVADSAMLWHGVFDGRGWRDTASIVVRQAWISPDFASDLVALGNEVAFAYAVGKPRARSVVLVRRRDGDWSSDTLVHSTGPEVRLAKADDSWLVAFAARDIYIAAVHSERAGWAAPRIAVRAGEASLLDPQLVVSRGTSIIWFTVRHQAAPDSAPHFALFAKRGMADEAPLLPVVPSYNRFAANVASELNDGRILWLLTPDRAGSRVSAVVLENDRILPPVDVPVRASLHAQAISVTAADEVWYFTHVPTTTGPPMALMLDRLRVHCGVARPTGDTTPHRGK